jgi:dethiobiotin synthetase
VKLVLVSGTDTGVGKTIVTAALAAIARSRGERVAVVKPVQTGVSAGAAADVEEIRRLADVHDLHELIRLRDPLAPATAARVQETQIPSVAEMAAAIRRLRDRDVVLVEGAGGLLVHLDAQGGTIADLARALDAPVVVVVRAGLGTLNHTALTCEALRSRGVHCAGVVVGSWPDNPGLVEICNLEDLPAYAGSPLAGRLPERAGTLDPEAFLAVASAGLPADIV